MVVGEDTVRQQNLAVVEGKGGGGGGGEGWLWWRGRVEATR